MDKIGHTGDRTEDLDFKPYAVQRPPGDQTGTAP